MFVNEGHGGEILQILASMLEHKQLVDVIIQVDSKEFPCHRSVLAAMCPYFRAMFTTPLTNSKRFR